MFYWFGLSEYLFQSTMMRGDSTVMNEMTVYDFWSLIVSGMKEKCVKALKSPNFSWVVF